MPSRRHPILLLGTAVSVIEIRKEERIAVDSKNLAEAYAQRAITQTQNATQITKMYVDQLQSAVNSGLISGTAAKEIFEPVAKKIFDALDAGLRPETAELKIQFLTTYSDIQVIVGHNEEALKYARQAMGLAELFVAKNRLSDEGQSLLYGALFRTADAIIARDEKNDAYLQEGLIYYKQAQRDPRTSYTVLNRTMVAGNMIWPSSTIRLEKLFNSSINFQKH